MPKPCDKELCAGQGHFDGDECPGSNSEEEMHHCVDCGELTWEDKGCDRCGAYWCQLGWQHTFIFPDCENFPGKEESICSPCFLADPSAWCNDSKCLCECKREEVKKKFIKFQDHGSLCGSGLLIKDGNQVNISVYRYNGQSKGRLSVKFADQKKETSTFFSSLEEAIARAVALLDEKFREGFEWSPPTCSYDENPYGVLK